METQINYIDELSLRVYQKIGEQQLQDFLINGNPLMNTDELAVHITENIDSYLSKEEKDQMVRDNLGGIVCDSERIKSAVIRVCIQLAALNVNHCIEKSLTSQDFAGDNPYSALTQPRMFMLYKFYDEQFGIKLQPKNLGELREYQ
jgi:hypothetical protein